MNRLLVPVVSLLALAATAPAALAAPSATTGTSGPGSDPRTTQVLRGTVNAEGCPVTVRFNWEKASTYQNHPGSFANSVDAVAQGGGAYSATVTGLAAGNTYSWRIKALQQCPSQPPVPLPGAVKEFTTGTAHVLPTIVDDFSQAGDDPRTSWTVGAHVDADGCNAASAARWGTAAGRYPFFHEADRWSGVDRNFLTALTLTDLAPGTTYHWRFDVTNCAGSASGPDATFTTAPAPASAVRGGLASAARNAPGALGPAVFGTRGSLPALPVRAAEPGTAVALLGATLIAQDGASLINQDGASLIAQDGASLIAQDGASLITQDGASLIGQDGASLTRRVATPATERRRVRRKRLLLATARRVATAPGRYRLQLRPTKTGRRIFAALRKQAALRRRHHRRPRRVGMTLALGFDPAAGAKPVVRTTRFTVRRPRNR